MTTPTSPKPASATLSSTPPPVTMRTPPLTYAQVAASPPRTPRRVSGGLYASAPLAVPASNAVEPPLTVPAMVNPPLSATMTANPSGENGALADLFSAMATPPAPSVPNGQRSHPPTRANPTSGPPTVAHASYAAAAIAGDNGTRDRKRPRLDSPAGSPSPAPSTLQPDRPAPMSRSQPVNPPDLQRVRRELRRPMLLPPLPPPRFDTPVPDIMLRHTMGMRVPPRQPTPGPSATPYEFALEAPPIPPASDPPLQPLPLLARDLNRQHSATNPPRDDLVGGMDLDLDASLAAPAPLLSGMQWPSDLSLARHFAPSTPSIGLQRPPTPRPLPSLLPRPPSPFQLPSPALPRAFPALDNFRPPGSPTAHVQHPQLAMLAGPMPPPVLPIADIASMTGYQFTPPPPGGFPHVLFPEHDSLLNGLSELRARAILDPLRNPVLVQLWNVAYPSHADVANLTSAITGAVQSITGIYNFLVVPPEPIWAAPGVPNSAPFTWAIFSLPPDAVHRLVDGRVWSAPAITFFAYPRPTGLPDHLFALNGFTNNFEDAILQAVQAVFYSPDAIADLIPLLQTNPDFQGRTINEAVRDFLHTLRVDSIDLRNGQFIATVATQPPSHDPDAWRDWRDRMANLPYPTGLSGTGVRRPPSLCAGCHSAAHPTHHCPFRLIPGWNAPPPGTRYGPSLIEYRRNHPVQQQQQPALTSTSNRGRPAGSSQRTLGRC
ncbi:hypothetical protein FKP32DRAFT_1680345 [Trametes sanguinea]|nr:hypothetical protein FKP32DRAFT_1680345 [Trametes sanguinea]